MRRSIVSGFALAAFLLVCGVGRADIAPDPEYGQSLTPREGESVAMTAEEVTITLNADSASVRAVFWLRNTGGAARLEVGFPDVAEASSHGSDGPPGDFSGYKLRGFEAEVDGEKVAHTFRWVRNEQSPRERAEIEAKIEELQAATKKVRDAAERDRIKRDLAWQQKRLKDWAWYGWLVWTMEFGAGQERVVKVDYTVPYRPPYRATILGDRTFEYVLQTGALWKGPIGRARVDVKFGEGVTRAHLGSIAPSGYADGEDGVAWDLRDIEPSEDVRIGVRRHADYAAAAQAHVAHHDEALRKGNPGAACSSLAWAAKAQEKGELWEACISSCEKIVAMEKEARDTGEGVKYARTWWKEAYLPWECMIFECRRRLGNEEQTRKAAAEALAACEDLLETGKNDRSLRFGFNAKAIEKRIAELEAYLAGGGE